MRPSDSPPPGPVEPSGTSTRLLVVEDDPDVAFMIREWLVRTWLEPVTVDTASTIAAALEVLASGPISAVLLDLGLPDTRGLEGVTAVRDRFPSVPVVVLTGRADDDLAAAALQLGAQDYVVKSHADPSQLCRTVRHAVDRQRFSEALVTSQQMLSDAQRVAHLGSWTWDLATDAVTWSDEMYRIYGVAPGSIQVTLDTVLDRVHPGDRERVVRTLATAVEDRRSFTADRRIVRPGGDVRILTTRGEVVLDTDGTPVRMTGTCQDVTEARAADEALRRSEERFRLLAENAEDVVFRLWVRPDMRFEYVSPAVSRMTGYEPDEFYGEANLLLNIVHPDDLDALLAAVRSRHDRPMAFRIQHRRGREVWLELRMVPVFRDGQRVAIEGIARDVTERKVVEAELAYQAMHDPLTGLPNRLLFFDRLRQSLARVRREQSAVAVLFLDLDHFKVVNDSLGHESGDDMLRMVATRLAKATRDVDTLARFGGDEFTVLGENIIDEAQAVALAERIAAALVPPFVVSGQEVFVTASIGIAMATAADPAAPDELLRDADAAMYRAKDRGRSRYEQFDPSMRTRALHKLETANALRRALERNEFWLAYQPLVAVADGRVPAVEALIRWNRPDIGTVPPMDFIPLAEDTGLIVAIGEWVLHEACRQIVEWEASRREWPQPERVWINLSARQLVEPTLIDTFTRAFARSGVDPHRIGVEITETALMEDAEAAATTLRALHDLGVQVAVDDFGTGYASLVYLRRFPVDVIKVDRSFVIGLGDNTGDSAIVTAMARLAHTLGIEVVAEGVEDAERFRRLSTVDYDFAQGYYWTPPLPAAELRTWLEDHTDADHAVSV